MKPVSVRTRFAPSPTGYLHVGGARTALFSWLFAQHHGGRFILRIEDTDRSRSTEEAVRAIIESMEWLGLDWDEGPYRQTERLELYKRAADRLLSENKAYYCYCTPEELEARRQAAIAAGRPPGYDRRCLYISERERREFEDDGRRPVLRFFSPDEGQTVFADIIRGEVSFDNASLDDLIILRADGVPTYNFAVVIDDVDLNISHVIRGEDHLSNTPRQIQIYQALGFKIPEFAHLPLILGPDKTLLSKRHGATSVAVYRDQGYLPEVMINYLALLGWSYDAETTIFSRDELIDKFSLDRVGKAAAVFDQEKLIWMNGVYIRRLPVDELTKRLITIWRQANLIDKIADDKLIWLTAIAKICQERLTILSEIVPLTDFFFQEEIGYDQAAVAKFLKGNEAARALMLARERLAALTDWSVESIEATLRSLAAELELKPGKLFQPVRVAVTGRAVSPPLFETLWLLGKDKSLRRLSRAIALVGE